MKVRDKYIQKDTIKKHIKKKLQKKISTKQKKK